MPSIAFGPSFPTWKLSTLIPIIVAEEVAAVFVAEYVLELLNALDVLDVLDELDVTGTLRLIELLKLLDVVELLDTTLTDGLITTLNSAALVHGPRFPASVYAMILTYLACASGKESILKTLVSG